MPNIKMKKREYKDENAIYDVMYYCLNHDLRYYNVMYLPVRNNCMNCGETDIQEEVGYMANFWNVMLDVNNKNCGKRFNHFVIGLGYDNRDKVHHFATILPETILEFMQDRGFPGLVAYHETFKGNHHLHVMIGITNIYGESVHINAYILANYLNSKLPYLKMQVKEDN